jgi:hypothetical protein
MATPREQELERALRQKEAELRQANSELEDRGKLLYKTKVRSSGPCPAAIAPCVALSAAPERAGRTQVAIEQLQQELISQRDQRDEANKVCEEQAAQLQQAEDQQQQFERELSKRAAEAQRLQVGRPSPPAPCPCPLPRPPPRS